MNVVIIGAGIGGLTMAIALQHKGIEFRVFEAVPQLRKVGAGISLANNAMSVYKKLGLFEDILSRSNPIISMNLTDTNLNILNRISLSPADNKHSGTNVVIHRGVLQEILLKAIDKENLKTGCQLVSMEIVKDSSVLMFSNGERVISELVIGADGIHSTTRKLIFDNFTLREAKQVCWRGIGENILPEMYSNRSFELWGIAKRFGFAKLSEKEVYWYAVANYKNDFQAEYPDPDLKNLFADFHPLVRDLIGSTDPEKVITTPIIDLKPMPKWHHFNICLIGDAAHATTPNMGQGACQAIEDAYLLTQNINSFDRKKAFRKFESKRKRKVNKIVRRSWKIGKLAHIENKIVAKFRNRIIKFLPNALAQMQNNSIIKV